MIVGSIKISSVSGIEEKKGVTTVVMSPWAYHYGYVRIGCE